MKKCEGEPTNVCVAGGGGEDSRVLKGGRALKRKGKRYRMGNRFEEMKKHLGKGRGGGEGRTNTG